MRGIVSRILAFAAAVLLAAAPALAAEAPIKDLPGFSQITLPLLHAGPNSTTAAPILLSINGPVTASAADSNGHTVANKGGVLAAYNGSIPGNLNTVAQCLNDTRQGFAFNGVSDFAATTYVDSLCADHTVREAFPNQAVTDPVNVALSRTVYADDVMAGVTNNSTLYSPPPICNWTTPGRRFLASGTSSVSMGFACFHRDARSGQEIVGGTCSLSDGTHTNSGFVQSTGTASLPGDVFTVEDYTCTASTSGLTAGVQLTFNVKAYPWLGTLAHGSVADSSLNTSAQSPGGSVERQFSPRYFILDDGTRPGPAVALWCPSGGTFAGQFCTAPGVDATAQFDTTTPNAAHAFLTLVKLLDTITDATKGKPFTKMAGCANGCADGVTVYVGCGGVVAPFTGQATTARPQLVGALKFTRDPSCAQANSNVQITAGVRPKLGNGTSLSPSGEGALWFDDLTYSRGGNFQIGNAADNSISVQFTNMTVENTSSANSAAFVVHGGQSFYGVQFNNGGSGTLADNCSTSTETRITRGVNTTAALSGTTVMTPWFVLGSKFNGASGKLNEFLGSPTCAQSGTILYSNYTAWPSASTDVLQLGVSNLDVNGAAIVQNIFEVNHTTGSTPIMGLARDCDSTSTFTGTITHLVVQYNVIPSPGEISSNSPGRWNTGYDSCSSPARIGGTDTPTIAYRPHSLWDVRGNVIGLWFIKLDYFVGHTTCAADVPCQTNQAPNMLGPFGMINGTDLAGNLQMYVSVANGGYGGDRSVNYLGAGSKAGLTANQSMTFDPLWVSPQYTTSNGVSFSAPASAGSGDYHLQGGSACSGVVPVAALKKGLYGDNRSTTNDACGVNP